LAALLSHAQPLDSRRVAKVLVRRAAAKRAIGDEAGADEDDAAADRALIEAESAE
jgi:hypothetical protein